MPRKDEPIYDALFKWTFGASWNWRTFDFNRDVSVVDSTLGPMVNATESNLDAFKQLGHKLIVYHGWADAIVPSLESIYYYESVEKAQAQEAASLGHGEVEETQGFYRLFMVPGMAHCTGGPGLNQIDAMEPLERWVEQGIAPGRIVAKRVENGVTTMTRPVCPYPQMARYAGTGNSNDAARFSCSDPNPQNGK